MVVAKDIGGPVFDFRSFQVTPVFMKKLDDFKKSSFSLLGDVDIQKRPFAEEPFDPFVVPVVEITAAHDNHEIGVQFLTPFHNPVVEVRVPCVMGQRQYIGRALGNGSKKHIGMLEYLDLHFRQMFERIAGHARNVKWHRLPGNRWVHISKISQIDFHASTSGI